jgi:hypothetical protein
MANFFKAYINPNKYSKILPIQKIIADSKIDKKYVKKIVNIIKSGEKIKAIVVVKHPKKNYYAVLDGHHRYWAFKILKIPYIKCAVVEDFFYIGFYMTKNGLLQPDPRITKYIRIPLKRFYLYINNFIRNPEKLIKKINKIIKEKNNKPYKYFK